jgi:hypothetical protein
MNPLTFRTLNIGERFVFTYQEGAGTPRNLLYNVKTSDTTYDAIHKDGHISPGRVGVGDNPVSRRTEEEKFTTCTNCEIRCWAVVGSKCACGGTRVVPPKAEWKERYSKAEITGIKEGH